jgi:hypothetical protein
MHPEINCLVNSFWHEWMGAVNGREPVTDGGSIRYGMAGILALTGQVSNTCDRIGSLTRFLWEDRG